MLDGLRELDRVEVTTLVDNYVDVLLANSSGVTRPALAGSGEIPADTLLAEHGLSLLVSAEQGGEKRHVLFDCGYSRIALLHNVNMLGTDLGCIDSIVISHGHMDHTGALYPVADSLSRPVPLILHPDAFLAPRYFGLRNGKKLRFPQTLSRPEIEKRALELCERMGPSLTAEAMVGITGGIERTTDFEKGLPYALAERDGVEEKDMILDDQCLVMNVKGKGLVVISGCGHAGIVNSVFYASKITGVERIYAVIGGFHLEGPAFEPIIERTVSEFKNLGPEVVLPMHCTGWAAIKRFSDEFPDAFVLNSVGTRVSL